MFSAAQTCAQFRGISFGSMITSAASSSPSVSPSVFSTPARPRARLLRAARTFSFPVPAGTWMLCQRSWNLSHEVQNVRMCVLFSRRK